MDLSLTCVIATQLWHHIYLGGGLCELPTWEAMSPGQETRRRRHLAVSHSSPEVLAGGGRMKRVTPDLWENDEDYPKSESGAASGWSRCVIMTELSGGSPLGSVFGFSNCAIVSFMGHPAGYWPLAVARILLTSHSLTRWSLSPEASVRPSGENFAVLTLDVPHRTVAPRRSAAKFQKCKIPVLPVATNTLPSGEYARLCTLLAGPIKLSVKCFSCKSQNRIFDDKIDESASVRPSGENAISHCSFESQLMTVDCAGKATWRTLTLPSLCDVARMVPSGEKPISTIMLGERI